MSIRTTNFGGTDFSDGEILYAADLNDTIEHMGYTPVGGVIAWLKTFDSTDSGTTTSTTSNKLVESGQNFTSTVSVGNLVHNSTDDTFAYVTAVDSNTTLSLDNDIMTTGETYVIYTTPELKNGWVECNGQTLSDAQSIFDGATIPDLNGPVDTGLRGYFLRGHTVSGLTQTDQNKAHTHTFPTYSATFGNGASSDSTNQQGTATTSSSGGDEARPHNYSVVWIMRVK